MASDKTYGSFKDILVSASPKLRPVCELLRRLVVSQHDGFYEVVWPRLKIASFGVGPKKMTQHYAYIAVQPSYINLGFYHGASLRDPTALLCGFGKELRHIKVHDISSAESPEIRELLRQAVDERRSYA